MGAICPCRSTHGERCRFVPVCFSFGHWPRKCCVIRFRTASSWTLGGRGRSTRLHAVRGTASRRGGVACAQAACAGTFRWKRQRPLCTGRIEPAMLVWGPAKNIGLARAIDPSRPAGSPNWYRRLSPAKSLPTTPLVAPEDNIHVFPEWSPLAILLAPTGAHIQVALKAEGKFVSSYSIRGIQMTLTTHQWEKNVERYRVVIQAQEEQIPRSSSTNDSSPATNSS